MNLWRKNQCELFCDDQFSCSHHFSKPLGISPFSVILLTEVSSTAVLCSQVDGTVAVERARLLRAGDDQTRQLDRLTSSCTVVRDLLGRVSPHDVAALRNDLLYSLETPDTALHPPTIPRSVPAHHTQVSTRPPYPGQYQQRTQVSTNVLVMRSAPSQRTQVSAHSACPGQYPLTKPRSAPAHQTQVCFPLRSHQGQCASHAHQTQAICEPVSSDKVKLARQRVVFTHTSYLGIHSSSRRIALSG